MKKIALFLMAAFAVIACEEQEAFVPHLDFQPAEVTIPTAGTENLETPVTFTFTANAAWTATLNGENVGEWLSITPKSGDAGEATITFNATENKPGKDARVATLEIALEGLDPVIVNVTQLQKNAIDVNAEAAYTVPFTGQTLEVEVGANVDYTYELTYNQENNVDWITETKAYATDIIKLVVAPQPAKGVARSATLTVYSELGVVKVITITQSEWTPLLWSESLVDNGASYGRVGVAAVGDKVYYTANGELWTVDEATGANATKVTLPEGFVAGGVHADDAGNLLVSGEDRAPGAGQLQLFKVNADGGYTPLVDYNSANYWCTEMGNLRVKGDVTKNALITAYICVGTGHYAAWEVKDGVVADSPIYGDLPSGSWDASQGVVAPAGPAMADGLYSITYGGNYSISYYDGSAWTEVWVSGSSWMENYSCIATAEVGAKKYLALTASTHFSYDYTELIVLDVTDLAAVTKVYSIQMQIHTQTTDINDDDTHGLTFSDVALVSSEDGLAIYVVDSWMDSVEKYFMGTDLL